MRRRFSPDLAYGDWRVIEPAPRSERGDLRWLCRCECGTERVVLQKSLVAATSANCGCRTRFPAGNNRRVTHGATVGGYTPEYRAWLHMRNRCYNPNVKKFENHGGRGIGVCDAWRHSFEKFLADMGPRPSARHSIDRIDNDGNYEPGNCRWALPRVQQGNKSVTFHVLLNGERLALRHACEAAGVSYRLVHLRLRRGWSLADAVSKPIGPQSGIGTRPASALHSGAELRAMFGRAA